MARGVELNFGDPNNVMRGLGAQNNIGKVVSSIPVSNMVYQVGVEYDYIVQDDCIGVLMAARPTGSIGGWWVVTAYVPYYDLSNNYGAIFSNAANTWTNNSVNVQGFTLYTFRREYIQKSGFDCTANNANSQGTYTLQNCEDQTCVLNSGGGGCEGYRWYIPTSQCWTRTADAVVALSPDANYICAETIPYVHLFPGTECGSSGNDLAGMPLTSVNSWQECAWRCRLRGWSTCYYFFWNKWTSQCSLRNSGATSFTAGYTNGQFCGQVQKDRRFYDGAKVKCDGNGYLPYSSIAIYHSTSNDAYCNLLQWTDLHGGSEPTSQWDVRFEFPGNVPVSSSANMTAGSDYDYGLIAYGYGDHTGTKSGPRLTRVFGVRGFATSLSQGAYFYVPYDSSMNPSSLTVVLWFKYDGPASLGAETQFLCLHEGFGSGGYCASLNETLCVKVLAQDSNNGGEDRIVSGPRISAGSWMQLAFSMDADLRLYYNGELKDVGSFNSYDACSGTPNLYIGQPNGGAFDFSIDELLIKSSQMSDASVLALYGESTCAPGWYYNGTMCAECFSTCGPGMMFVSVCDGHGFNSGPVCASCDVSCSRSISPACTGTTSSDCLDCAPGYGKAYLGTACVICPAGQFLDTGPTPDECKPVSPTPSASPGLTSTATASVTGSTSLSATASITPTPSPLVCNVACNQTLLCLDATDATCDRCNETSYARAMDSQRCIGGCPPGQFVDTSDGPGFYRCRVFAVQAVCANSACVVTEDTAQVNATVTISLSRPPDSNVVVSLSTTTKGFVNVDSVTLTPSNWDKGINVTVYGMPNGVLDGVVHFALRVGPATSSDTRYTLSLWQLPMLAFDSDASTVAFQAGAMSTTTYEGVAGTAAYVAMRVQPAGPVIATVASSNTQQCSVATGASLMFSTTNYFMPQLVTLTCPRNYIAEGNVSFSLDVTAPSLVGTSVALLNIDADTAGVDISHASFWVNELGADKTVTVALRSKPLVPVTVGLAASDASLLTVIPSTLYFTATNWATPQSFSVTGLRTAQPHGNMTVSVLVSTRATSGSGAAQYELGASSWPAIPGVNIRLHFPVVFNVLPRLSALLGGWNLTATGSEFLAGMKVLAFQDSVSARATQSASAASAALVLAESTDGTSVRFMTPAMGATGYATLRFANPDGGYTDAAGLFYTDDCPKEGMFGRGKECIDCPEGAECPGGYRLWPLVGYWNPSEFAGFVSKCPDPPERCLGGQMSPCGQGYTGELCATCAPGYFAKDSECAECGSNGVLVTLVLVNAVFIGLLTLAMVVLPDAKLYVVVITVALLQGVRAVGQMASSKMPAFLKAVYFYLSLVSFDVSFLRAECTFLGSGYSFTFWINMALVAALIAPLVIALLVLAAFHRARRAQYLNRLVRGLTVYAAMLYLIICTRVFQAVYCVNVGTQSKLVSDPALSCGSTSSPVTKVAWVVAVTMVMGYPIAMTSYLFFLFKKARLEEPVTLARFGYVYNRFRHNRIMFAGVGYMQLLLLALAAAIKANPGGVNANVIQLLLSGTAYLIPLVLIGALRPYKEPVPGVLSFLTALAGLLAVIYNFVGSWALHTGGPALIGIGAALVVVFLTAVGSAFVVLWRTGRLPARLYALLPRLAPKSKNAVYAEGSETPSSTGKLIDDKSVASPPGPSPREEHAVLEMSTINADVAPSAAEASPVAAAALASPNADEKPAEEQRRGPRRRLGATLNDSTTSVLDAGKGDGVAGEAEDSSPFKRRAKRTSSFVANKDGERSAMQKRWNVEVSMDDLSKAAGNPIISELAESTGPAAAGAEKKKPAGRKGGRATNKGAEHSRSAKDLAPKDPAPGNTDKPPLVAQGSTGAIKPRRGATLRRGLSKVTPEPEQPQEHPPAIPEGGRLVTDTESAASPHEQPGAAVPGAPRVPTAERANTERAISRSKAEMDPDNDTEGAPKLVRKGSLSRPPS